MSTKIKKTKKTADKTEAKVEETAAAPAIVDRETVLREKAAKAAAVAARANAELLELTNPVMKALSEKLAAAEKAHTPYKRLIILRHNAIETAERKLDELRNGRFNAMGDLDPLRNKNGEVILNKKGEPIDNGKGLKQLFEEQEAAAKVLASVLAEIEAARLTL